ncbi:MAG: RCC1 domain-containing protein [Acidimicrobiales bacterium]
MSPIIARIRLILAVALLGASVPILEAFTPLPLERAEAVLSRSQRIAAGTTHSLAVLPNGTVRAWGSNGSGQLGNGTTTSAPTSTPVAVTGIGGVRAVEAGLNHSVAIVGDRTLRTWGANGLGQLGDGSGTQRNTPVAVAGGLTNVSAVAAGTNHTLAVADGSLRAWGNNIFRQLGNGTTTNRFTPAAVVGVSGSFVAVAGGDSHSLALTNDGKVWAWGHNNFGQLGRSTANFDGDPPEQVAGLPPIAAIAAGLFHSMALGTDGRVWTWGRNNAGQLGYNPPGVGSSVPRAVASLSAINAIGAGSSHSLAVPSDGSVRTWGSNSDGQLGNNTCCAASVVPVTAVGLDGALVVAGGGSHSVAIKINRSGAVGWGANASGQVGDTTTANRPAPVNVANLAIANIPLPGEILGPGGPTGITDRCSLTLYPIDCASGNFWHSFTDLAIGGRGPGINLERTYNSLAAGADSGFGFGWASTYTMALSIDAPTATVTITQENGSQATFSSDGDGGYYVAPRTLASLVANGDGTFTFTRRQRERFDFNAGGQLVAITDLNGYATTLTRPNPSTIVVTDSSGRTLTLGLTGTRITSATDSASPPRTVTYSYDGAGNLVDVVDVTGGHTTFTYDSTHRLVTMREPKFFADTTTTPAPVVTNAYDAQSRTVSQSDPLGRVTTFDYTTTPGATRITDPKGNAQVQTYASGVLTSITKGAGTPSAATWIYDHDPATLGISKETDPNGGVTVRSYDPRGNVTSETDPLGRISTFTYDGANNLTASTDASGVVTTMAYDAGSNLTSVSAPLRNSDGATVATATTTYNYAEASPARPGDLTSMVDATGGRWSFSYDAAGNRVSTTDPVGNKTTATFDAVGRKSSEVGPRGNEPGANPAEFTTNISLRPDNLPTAVVDPLGGRTEWTYDLNANVASTTDPLGKITSRTHNPADELTAVTRADGSAVAYEYFGDGALRSYRDAAGATTAYGYDPLGRRNTATDPLGRVTTTIHDAVGNLIRRIDPGGDCGASPAVGCRTYTYDLANQLRGIDYSDPATPDVTALTYDPVGRRTAMTDGTGTSTWTWDSLGRLSASTTGATVAGGGQSVGYGYDLAGRLTSLIYPGGGTVARRYDPAGNLIEVTDQGGRVHAFAYDAADNLTAKTLANATAEGWTYDRADRLSTIGATKAAATLARFTYGRDAAHQVVSVTSTGVPADNHTYNYTPLNQLGAVDAGSYTYDPADNLTTGLGAIGAYDAANQLCHMGPLPGPCSSPPAGATTFGYDSRGNRTTVTPPTGGSRSFTYDQVNRLTSVPGPSVGFSAISAGAFHSLALRADTTVAAWGRNANGQLGDSTVTSRSAPVSVSGLSGVTALAAGTSHSLAVVAGGAVKAWGNNANAKLGDNTTTQRLSPVAVSGLTNVTAVAAGANHSLALRTDGTVWAWGRNTNGQLGDGTVITRKTPVVVAGLSNVSAIAAGDNYSLALRTDGTVAAWGLNTNGQLGDATVIQRLSPVDVVGLATATKISAGAVHSLAVLSDGTVRAWGSNGSGRLGDGTTTGRLTPVAVVGLAGVSAIDAGASHSLAVLAGGGVRAWGANTNAKLGDATTTTRKTPVAVSGLPAMSDVAAGTNHSLARAPDASARGWGLNTDGQVGDASTTTRTTPVSVAAPPAPTPTTYAYNGDGLRMAKTTGTNTTAFTWDASASLPLLLSEGSGASRVSYVYGPGDQPLVRIDSAGNALYYHGDQLGSTRVLTDSTGAVVATYTYDAYGKRSASTGAIDQPLGYTGQYTDAESGLIYLRARYYDPATANFLTRDPLETITGEVYGYSNANPVNSSDPSGLTPLFGGGCDSILSPILMLSCNPPAIGPPVLRTPPAEPGPEILGNPIPGIGGRRAINRAPPRDRTIECDGEDTGPRHPNGEGPSERPTVGEVLKRKRASITRQPLPAGAPTWEDIREMPIAEVDRRAQRNEPGFKTIKKLLSRADYDR